MEAVVSENDGIRLDEAYIVSTKGNVGSGDMSGVEFGSVVPVLEDQRTEQEPAAWAGRDSLNRSLSTWRADQQKERLVAALCFMNLF